MSKFDLQQLLDQASIKLSEKMKVDFAPKNGKLVFDNRVIYSLNAQNGSPNFAAIVFILFGAVFFVAGFAIPLPGNLLCISIGALFIVAGIAFARVKDSFTIDLNAKSWTRIKGLPNAKNTSNGALTEIERLKIERASESLPNNNKTSTFWSISIVWTDKTRNPINLRSLALAVDMFTEDTAYDIYQTIFSVTGIPLARYNSEVVTSVLEPIETVQQTPVEVEEPLVPLGESDLPRLPSQTQIQILHNPDFRLYVRLVPLIDYFKLVKALIPIFVLPFFYVGLFRTPSSNAIDLTGKLVFCGFLTLISSLVIVGIYFQIRDQIWCHNIQIDNNELIHFRSLRDIKIGVRRYSLSDLSQAELRYYQNTNRINTGAAYGAVNALTSSGNGLGIRYIVIFGHNVKDVNVGGQSIPKDDFDWYLAMLKGVTNSTLRDSVIATVNEIKPTELRSVNQTNLKRIWKPQNIVLIVLLLSLANSFVGGIGIYSTWSDAKGTKFYSFNSGWESNIAAFDRNSQLKQSFKFVTPFSQSSNGYDVVTSGDPIDKTFQIATRSAYVNAVNQIIASLTKR